MENYTQQLEDCMQSTGNLGQATPKFMEAFGAMGGASGANPALDLKTKELISVAIGITVKCVPCLLYHVNAAIEAGVSREEMVAMIEVCMVMGGGPASAYGAKALEIYDTFSKK